MRTRRRRADASEELRAEHPAARPSPHHGLLDLHHTAGNAAVAGVLGQVAAVQRLVDEGEAKKRVSVSEFKDIKKRLEAGGGTGMTTLYTSQFVRLASLFRKNRDSLNMLKADPLAHLGQTAYEKQDLFVETKVHSEIAGFTDANQRKIIDNVVSTSDLLESLASLSLASKKHIAVPKHAWNLVVASPATFQPSNEAAHVALHDPSWQQVETVMATAIAQGRQTLYKATFQRIAEIGGQQVAVTFAVVDGKPRVSDAWVVTR